MQGEQSALNVNSVNRFPEDGTKKSLQTKLSFVCLYLLPATPMAAVWLAEVTQRHFVVWVLLSICVIILSALGPSRESFTYANIKGLTLSEIVSGALPRTKLILLVSMAVVAVASVLWIDPEYAPGIIIFLVITGLFLGMALPDIGQEEVGISRKFLSVLLDSIPAMLIVMAVASFVWAQTQVSGKREVGDVAWLCAGIAFALSNIVTVAHALSHGVKWERWLSKLYFSMLGYPHFVHEHAMLHGSGRSGRLSTGAGSIAAKIGENFYSYFKRRVCRGWQIAQEWQSMDLSSNNVVRQFELQLLCAVSVLTAICCISYAGLMGGMLWLLSCVFTHWNVQATNYLRHWGMTGRSLNQGATGTTVWEMNRHWDELFGWDRSEGTSHFRSPAMKYYAHTAVSERTAPVYPYSGLVMRFIVLVPRAHVIFSLPFLKKWRKEGGRRGTWVREMKALNHMYERRSKRLEHGQS